MKIAAGARRGLVRRSLEFVLSSDGWFESRACCSLSPPSTTDEFSVETGGLDTTGAIISEAKLEGRVSGGNALLTVSGFVRLGAFPFVSADVSAVLFAVVLVPGLVDLGFILGTTALDAAAVIDSVFCTIA